MTSLVATVGPDVGLRLVVQRQFAVLDRDREILVQHAAVADLLVHLRLEDADRAARFRLGAEQRRAGIGEQRGRVRAVVREDRDAGGTPVRTDLPSIWNSLANASASCSASAMPAAGCLPSMISPNSSPDSRATTPPRADGLEALRDLDQHLVADRMAEHVVDFLQPVEVDAQHREFLVGACAGLDHLRQRLQEGGAVRQVGQAVMIGHVRHARFGLAAVGDVLVGLDQILRLAGLVEHGHAAGQEQPQAVLGARSDVLR